MWVNVAIIVGIVCMGAGYGYWAYKRPEDFIGMGDDTWPIV